MEIHQVVEHFVARYLIAYLEIQDELGVLAG